MKIRHILSFRFVSALFLPRRSIATDLEKARS